MENHNFNGKTHYKLPFSIAMLVYQRVCAFFETTFTVSGDFSHVGRFRFLEVFGIRRFAEKKNTVVPQRKSELWTPMVRTMVKTIWFMGEITN